MAEETTNPTTPAAANQDAELTQAHATHEQRRKRQSISYLGKNNRRQGADLILRLAEWSNTLCWALLISIMVTTHLALPDQTTIYSLIFNVPVNYSIDTGLIQSATSLSILMLVTAVAGLGLTRMRNRRSLDRWHKGLIFNICASLFFILLLLIKF
uniref:Uncharacterized protein n=1 Tax=Magnetococcus massalia (strain MO-1) TaxID=451514 RepID=A0A1S7LKH7_MAGMO|nr:conserved membrane protein of unknown function [Candidatus Magnetococcus massalia]